MSAGSREVRPVSAGVSAVALKLPHLPLEEAVAVGAILLACVSLHPFQSLATSASIELSSGGEAATYGCVALLAALGTGLAWRQLRVSARTLACRPLVGLFAWLALSCLVSPDLVTSLKRLVLALMLVVLGTLLVLLPGSLRRLAAVLAVSAGAVLVLSYGGVALAPDLAVHQITDLGEPELAGDWRGVFAHKNDAAGALSLFIFQGLFVARRGFAPAGWAIVAGSALFMLFAGGKSALALVVLTLLVARAWDAMPDRWPRMALALAPVVVLNLAGLGSVALAPVGTLVHALPIDSTFTGRDEIWSFAMDDLPGHLVLGHGFDGFWNTEATRYGGDEVNWAGSAAHAHNSYLDAVVNGGLPGLALTLLAFVWRPMRDLVAAERRGADPALLALLTQSWLFGLYLSGFETIFFHRDDPLWLFFLFSVAGLRIAATFRLKRDEAAA